MRTLTLRLNAVLAVVALASGASLVAQTPTRPGPESRVVDPNAIPILEAMDAAFAQAQGLSAVYKSEVVTPSGRPMQALSPSATLTLGRPNVYRLEFANGRRIVSNGEARYDISSNRCTMAD